MYDIEVLLQPPPGPVVAPEGFPADPRPQGAPQIFLDAMSIRIKVFCEEQNCAIEPELDEDDPRSWSWVAYKPSAALSRCEAISTVRIVPPPHAPHPNGYYDLKEQPYVKLTRVATLKHERGRGISTRLILQALEYLAAKPAVIGNGWAGRVLTHAQVSVEGVYQKLGFVTDKKLGRWNEEGIEHIGMWKQLELRDTRS